MNFYRRLLLLALLILTITVSCQGQTEGTPTPVTTGDPAPLIINREVFTIDFAELAAAPAAYEGYRLRLTGLYKPLPTLVCATDAYPSPAAWGLVADGYLAYIDGYAYLRSLLPAGLTMTVEGQWRHWQGPIGCGKQAAYQEFWYLAASHIIDPSPIARVTLTPAGGEDVIAQLGTPEPTVIISEGTPIAATETATLIVGETAVPPTPTLFTLPPVPTPPLTSTVTPAVTPVITPTPTPITITITPTVDEESKSETPTSTPTTGAPGSITATPTGNGTPQPTATPQIQGTNTPGPSPTPTSTPILVDMGNIEDQFLAVESLGINEAHNWDISIGANDVLTAYVAALEADVIVTLLDENGVVIVTQNNAPVGAVETLVQPIANNGVYSLRISSSTATATDYALMLRLNDSYAFVLKGTIRYGESKETTLPAENDEFWHFHGEAGDKITITVLPDAGGDAFLKLYDSEAEDMSGFVDDGGVGEAEEYSATLPAAGLYSIRIGEFDFLPMSYTIVLVKN